MAGDYTVKVVEQDGTILVNPLANVNVDPMTWTLNETGQAGLSFPKATASSASLLLLDKEVQIFRDGTLKWWGPMVGASTDADAADVMVSVPDPSWYFTRRQISDARANRLGNPQFETGLVGWTASGVTATGDTTRHALGSAAAKLVQANAGVDTHLHQQVTETATAIGDLFTLVAWVYVQNSGYVGPALDARGLYVEGIEAGVVRTVSFAEIDDATPRDRWVRLETEIWIPPAETWTLDVRLYAPGGTVWWDAVQLVRMESLSHYATDMGTIAGNVVAFVQNSTHGWDDVNVAQSNATTGVLLDRHYQYADHTDAMQALGEFEEMGLDWSIELTTTTRTFTTYYPKGTDRSGSVTLSMRSPSNPTGTLSDYHLTVDGAATSTRVTILGEGDGPDREEGYAADAYNLGGLALGEVVQARPNSPIDALATIAANRLADSKRLVRVLEIVGIPSDSTQIDTLVVGDTVTVSISDGWVLISGTWRIVRKTLDPATDTCSFTLNEVAASVVVFDGDAPVQATLEETLDGGTPSTGLVSVVDGGSP